MKRKQKPLTEAERLGLKASALSHIMEHRKLFKDTAPLVAAKAVPKTWADRLTINLKGGVWIGLFTFLMLVGCANALFFGGKDVPEGVRWIYGIIVGTFGATKGVGKLMNGKNGVPVEED